MAAASGLFVPVAVDSVGVGDVGVKKKKHKRYKLTLIDQLLYEDCDADCRQPCGISISVRQRAADVIRTLERRCSQLSHENRALNRVLASGGRK